VPETTEPSMPETTESSMPVWTAPLFSVSGIGANTIALLQSVVSRPLSCSACRVDTCLRGLPSGRTDRRRPPVTRR